MTRFTLVLGGGGSTGIAYICGALRALAEAGLEPNDADTIIGTSAGSVVGADLRVGRTVQEILEGVLPDAEGRSIERAWGSRIDLARRLVGSTWIMSRVMLPVRLRTSEPPALLQRAFPGSLFLLPGEQNWADERYPQPWPERPLWTVTCDLDTGRRIVLGRGRSTASLAQAVLASCAVPGLYPPVRVGDRRLVDGGVHSVANLDLAATTGSGLVIALAPMAFDPRRPPGQLRALARGRNNAQLAREAQRVRRSHKRVLLLRPTREELAVHGVNLLRNDGNDRVAAAAYEATARRMESGGVRRMLESAT